MISIKMNLEKKSLVTLQEEREAKQQDSRCLISGCKRLLQKIQEQIYRAKSEGNIARVHSLQNSLCDSFCARFVATEYAIIGLQLNRVEMSSLRVFDNPLAKEKREKEFSQAYKKISSIHVKSRSKLGNGRSACVRPMLASLRDASDAKGREGRAQVSEYCKIFVAQSLWRSHIKQEHEGRAKHSFVQRVFLSKKAGDTQKRYLEILKQSLVVKIREQAEQIHLILALEPEWQAALIELKKSVNPYCDRNPKTFQFKETPCNSSAFKANKTVEDITLYLRNNSLPQFVMTVPVCEYLHAVNYQALLRKLNTFEGMKKRIEFLVRNAFFEERQRVQQENLSSTRSQVNLLEKKVKNLSSNTVKHKLTHQDDDWCSLLRTHSFPQTPNTVLNFSTRVKKAQRDCVWPTARFSFYSCFPRILWKEQPLFGGYIEIENYTYHQDCIISRFLLRVLFHDLVENTVMLLTRGSLDKREWTQPFPCKKQSFFERILKRTPKKEKGDLSFLDKELRLSSTGNIKRLKKADEMGVFFPNPRFGIVTSNQERNNLFFTGDLNHFVVIHSNKESLQACALQIRQYLLGSSLSYNQEGSFDLDCVKDSTVDLKTLSWMEGAPVLVESASTVLHNVHNKVVQDHLFKQEKGSWNLERLNMALKIRDCRKGIVLFGFQIIQVLYKSSYLCKVTPSKKSVQNLTLFIKNRAKQSQSASTSVWIQRLNLLLCRWVEYYKGCEHRRSYHKISYVIWKRVSSWLSYRKSRKKRLTNNRR